MALQPGATADEAELAAFVRECLASYRWPQSVTSMDSLPKNGTGKIVTDLLW